MHAHDNEMRATSRQWNQALCSACGRRRRLQRHTRHPTCQPQLPNPPLCPGIPLTAMPLSPRHQLIQGHATGKTAPIGHLGCRARVAPAAGAMHTSCLHSSNTIVVGLKGLNMWGKHILLRVLAIALHETGGQQRRIGALPVPARPAAHLERAGLIITD